MPFFGQYFSDHGFYKDGRVYYQPDLNRRSDFEQKYIELRRKEGRVYDDETVRNLPTIKMDHPNNYEWIIRKKSAGRLREYLRRIKAKTVLEIGCGNGWLLNFLQQRVHAEYGGIDINGTELMQAARVFGESTTPIDFAYADIFSPVLTQLRTDIIILSSCIQYFPDLAKLIAHLSMLLNSQGEIHILDSPLYNEQSIVKARERSASYFAEQDSVPMRAFYYHHDRTFLQGLRHSLLYNPDLLRARLKRKFFADTPFPWIKIER